jgi:hypothetical protein
MAKQKICKHKTIFPVESDFRNAPLDELRWLCMDCPMEWTHKTIMKEFRKSTQGKKQAKERQP